MRDAVCSIIRSECTVDYLRNALHASLSFSGPSTMWESIRKHFKRKETSGKYVNELTDGLSIMLHDTNRRFRVLILGPANAGKTTLLERLTESPAGAAIVTRNGRHVILHFPFYRYSGLIFVYLSDQRGPQGTRSSKSYRRKCTLWLLDVFILSRGLSARSTTKSLTHQTLASFSTTRAVSKREVARRVSGNLFKCTHQLVWIIHHENVEILVGLRTALEFHS